MSDLIFNYMDNDYAVSRFLFYETVLDVVCDQRINLILIDPQQFGELIGYSKDTIQRLINGEWSHAFHIPDHYLYKEGDELRDIMKHFETECGSASKARRKLFLTEAGMDMVLLMSHRPFCIRVKHWLSKEVLPKIRRGTIADVPSVPKIVEGGAVPRSIPDWSLNLEMAKLELERDKLNKSVELEKLRLDIQSKKILTDFVKDFVNFLNLEGFDTKYIFEFRRKALELVCGMKLADCEVPQLDSPYPVTVDEPLDEVDEPPDKVNESSKSVFVYLSSDMSKKLGTTSRKIIPLITKLGLRKHPYGCRIHVLSRTGRMYSRYFYTDEAFLLLKSEFENSTKRKPKRKIDKKNGTRLDADQKSVWIIGRKLKK